MAHFGKKHRQDTTDGDSIKLVDLAALRPGGVLVRAHILEIESTPIVGENVAEPAFDCTLRIEMLIDYDKPYQVKIRQRLTGSALARITGDYIIAPAWVDPKDRFEVAVDVSAGQIEHTPPD